MDVVKEGESVFPTTIFVPWLLFPLRVYMALSIA